MPVSNPIKTVSKATVRCGDRVTVTLGFDASPNLIANPTDMVLMMDRSGSMTGAPLAAAKEAAKTLMQTVALASGSTAGDSIENDSLMGLVSFSDQATVDMPLTTDIPALNVAIDGLRAGGSTDHQKAFQKAYELLQSSTKDRRLLILFTDGVSNLGNADVIAETIKQEGIEIYCVGLAADRTSLERWANDPAGTYVAATDQVSNLQRVFAEIAAEAVQAGTRDMVLRETLNPDFKLLQVHQPSVGSVQVLDGQNLEWTADAVGAAGPETASLTFEVLHTAGTAGTKKINASITYADREQQSLTFPDPEVVVVCEDPIILPEACPLPATFLVNSCRDAAQAEANLTRISGLGRIVQVDVTVENVCPGREMAVAVILSELDADGVEHPRGSKVLQIPAQDGEHCRDLQLKCISFVVPEALDATGSPLSLCNARSFRTRVLANYTDTDFVCCDPQTVLL